MKLYQLNLAFTCEIAVRSKFLFPDIKQQQGLLASLVCFPGSGSAVFNDLLFQAKWIGNVFIQHPDKLTQIKLIRFFVLFVLNLSAKLLFDKIQQENVF